MGFINQFDLGRIIREFGISNFFETGTWKGDAVGFALQFPFERIISAEIVPIIAEAATLRFQQEKRVKIYQASSAVALSTELPSLQGNCLFWLDAHFPGADAGMAEYDAMKDENIRLPLEQELTIIHQHRKHFRDILIIDDLRVYEDGPYENGNAPSDTIPKNDRNIDFAHRLFGETHAALKSYRDEGYLLLVPGNDNKVKASFSKDLFLSR